MASKKSNVIRMFAPENRAKILTQSIDKPTGVVAEIGGLPFSLHPFTTEEGRIVFGLLRKFGNLTELVSKETLTEADLANIIGEEGDHIVALAKSVLKRAGNVQTAEEVELFDEWFASLQLVPLIKTLAPAVIKANALQDLMGNPTAAPLTEAQVQTAQRNLRAL